MRWPGVVLLLCLAGSAPGGPLQDDLKARRERLMENLGPRTLLIARSAPEKIYSLDVEYEYRQDSDFYYLTGIDQPDSTLILMPGNAERKEYLFVAPRNPTREHWTGKLLSPAEATERSGIANVHSTPQLESFLDTVLSGKPFLTPADLKDGKGEGEFASFLSALQGGDARLAVVTGEPSARMHEPAPAAMVFANQLRDRFPGFSVIDATSQIHGLRQVKSPYERDLLRRSADISVEAHKAGMRAARAGAREYEVKAAIEYVYRNRGAIGWGYPSITGSGPNSMVLHYVKSDRRMDSGDLMLVDAAANIDYYTVDITRTYPVSGKFNDRQKEIYRLVLQAQDEAMKVARVGVFTRDIHQKTVDVIKEGLFRLGLITDTKGDQYRMWYTHGSCHYIGMDVHDVGDYRRPIQPGHAFVMEPGIYIRPEALEALPKTAENAALMEKIRPAVEKYQGIGVRIEDSFLMTESGLERLSRNAPRTIEEIEEFMKRR